MSTNMNDWIVYDTESDGFVFEATKIHVISMVPVGGEHESVGKMQSYYGNTIEQGLEELANAGTIIAHNQMKHDIPLIQKLYPGWEPPLVIDTLVLSALLFPERMGGHGIEAWARRFGGEQKVQHEDWTKFSMAMLGRCESDVRLNKRILHRLMKEAYEPLEGTPFFGFDFGDFNYETHVQT